MTDPNPKSLDRVRTFWDESARQDAKVAIFYSPDMLDPARKEAAFERAGEEDARKLSWFLDPDATVVDLGCGIGRVLKRLAPHCKEIVGIDISPEMLGRARDYLAGTNNVRLLRNDGWTLTDVPDQSVEFLYSLLVLIHVDKRHAYQYFREFKRVLKPGGRLFLQFQDILTREGMAKFVAAVGTDYPLEFYAPEEVRTKLRHVGLDILAEETGKEYLFVIAVNGDAETWRQEFARDVRIEGFDLLGCFGTGRVDFRTPGEIHARVTTVSRRNRVVVPFLSITRQGEGPMAAPFLRCEGSLVLKPAGRTDIVFRWDPARGGPTLTAEPGTVTFPRSECAPPATQSQGVLHLGLQPSGFSWSAPTLRWFPAYFTERPVEVMPPPAPSSG